MGWPEGCFAETN